MKATKYPYLSTVYVTWIDSSVDEGWQYASHERPLEEIVTLGFVSACHKDSLEVTSTMGTKRGMLNRLRIPWGSIKKVKVIEEAKHGAA